MFFVRDIKGLTGLRGYAALMVCLHHYNYRKSGTLFYDIVAKGDWGVIVFFVLSGFVLAYVYQDWFKSGLQKSDFIHFMRLRLARVYPLHLVMLILWGLLILYGRIAITENDTLYTFLLNLTLTHAWGFTPTLSWNLPSWSISSELFCYLLFPLLIVLVRNKPIYLLIFVMVVLLIEPFYHPYAYMVKFFMDAMHLNFVVHQFEYGVSLVDWFCTFAFGVVSFCLFDRRTLGGVLPEVLFLCGVGIFIYIYSINLSDNDVIRVIITFASALIIASVFYDSRLAAVILGNPLAVFLGLISYALYLSHIILKQVMSLSWPMWAYVSSALLVATFIHYFFEKPCRNWLRSVK